MIQSSKGLPSNVTMKSRSDCPGKRTHLFTGTAGAALRYFAPLKAHLRIKQCNDKHCTPHLFHVRYDGIHSSHLTVVPVLLAFQSHAFQTPYPAEMDRRQRSHTCTTNRTETRDLEPFGWKAAPYTLCTATQQFALPGPRMGSPPPGHSSKDAVHSSCTRRSRHAGRHCAHRIHLYPCFKGLRSGSRLGVLWPSRAEQQIEHAMRRRDLEVQQPRRVPAALKLSARFWDCALLGVQQRVRPSLVGGLAHARRGGLIAEAQMQVTRMCDLHAKHCAARSDVISNAYECQETNPGSFRMISFNANLQQAARKDTTIVRHGQADDTRTT